MNVEEPFEPPSLNPQKPLMKRLALTAGTVARSRALRRNATPAERRMQGGLREAFPEAKFRFQVPLGLYYADFCSHSAKLVIEVDGGQHSDATEYDAARTEFINGEGYTVIRFWNNEVMENLDGVVTRIQNTLSPCGRG
jgi:very-short-patch-repair endonuclease